MDKQAIFDRVWEHFVTEGHPAGFDPESENCLYHTEQGSGCAIGIFDEDHVLNADDPPICTAFRSACMDHVDNERVRQFAEDAFGVTDRHRTLQVEFLIELQRAHDRAAIHSSSDPDEFTQRIERRLRWLADKYDLKAPAEVTA